MNAYTYIKKNLFVKLKPSNISGIGVFAIRDIEIGTFLFQPWDGETGFYPISQSELNELDEEVRNHIKDMFQFSSEFPKDTNLYVKLTKGCHWIYTNPYYFVNSGFYENKSNIDKELMIATKSIKKGQEILSDYQRYEKLDKKII